MEIISVVNQGNKDVYLLNGSLSPSYHFPKDAREPGVQKPTKLINVFINDTC